MAYTINQVAAMCHDANRRLCIANGDNTQVAWEDAPDWQRASAIEGVRFHLDNPEAPASAGHDNWSAEKIAAGWKFGETKDPEAKTHPCLLPFDRLPPEQQAKDHLFRGIVHSLAPFISWRAA